MKIAFLYSGHLRTWEKTYEFHKKFMETLSLNNDIRIFCQTWDSIESKTGSWWKNGKEVENNTIEIKDLLINTIKPDSIRINNELKPVETPEYYKGIVPYNGVLSMFYSAKESYSLYIDYNKQHNWGADVLIKLRYDITFSFETLINKLMELNKNSENIIVYSSRTYDFYGSYSDILIASSSKNTSFYSAYYKLTDNIFLKTYFNKFKEFISEIFVAKFILNKANSIILNDSLKIIRSNGDIHDVSLLEKESHSLEDIKNINYQYIQKYSDQEEFRKDVFNFLDRLQLSYYKIFYKTKIDFRTIISALKLFFLKNKNKVEIVEVLNYAFNNPGISLVNKIALKLISKTLSFHKN